MTRKEREKDMVRHDKETDWLMRSKEEEEEEEHKQDRKEDEEEEEHEHEHKHTQRHLNINIISSVRMQVLQTDPVPTHPVLILKKRILRAQQRLLLLFIIIPKPGTRSEQ